MQTEEEQEDDVFKTSRIKSIFENIHNYVEARLELYKIAALEKVAKVMADLITVAILAVCATLFILFLSIAFSLLIGKWLGDVYLGFLVIAGLYFIAGLIIYFNRKNLLQKPILEAAIKEILEEDDETKN